MNERPVMRLSADQIIQLINEQADEYAEAGDSDSRDAIYSLLETIYAEDEAWRMLDYDIEDTPPL